jgi:hypothetical protein
VHQVGHYPESHEDARSTKHKINTLRKSASSWPLPRIASRRTVNKTQNNWVDKVKTEMDDSNSIAGDGEKFVQQFKLKLWKDT